MDKKDWFRIIIILIIITIIFSYLSYGTIIPPQISDSLISLRGNTIKIDWQSWDGTKCYEFNKKTNLMYLDVLRDCRESCVEEYHLTAKDYDCNIETGIVTCLCS